MPQTNFNHKVVTKNLQVTNLPTEIKCTPTSQSSSQPFWVFYKNNQLCIEIKYQHQYNDQLIKAVCINRMAHIQ